ncbi:MAG TPA: hypothetical protein VFZ84_05590 [Burkholderiales bacterium]
MKRLIVAVALALATTPLLAEDRGAPFEQTTFDRALPTLPEKVAVSEQPVSAERMPYDQHRIDTALPNLRDTGERVMLAQIGGTSYKSAGEESASPWANDHNFIAPPQ